MTLAEIKAKIIEWIKTGIPFNVKSSNVRALLTWIAIRIDIQEVGRLKVVKTTGNSSKDQEIGDRVSGVVEDTVITDAIYLGGDVNLLSSYKLNPYLSALDFYGDNKLIDFGYYNIPETYQFDVWVNKFIINGQIHSNLLQETLTLSDPDATLGNDRFDLIVVSEDDIIFVIEGVTSTTPDIPSYDAATHLVIATILVSGASAFPDGIENTTVYNENTQIIGGEWDTWKSGDVDLESTIDFKTGAKSIYFFGEGIARFKNDSLAGSKKMFNLILSIKLTNLETQKIGVAIGNKNTSGGGVSEFVTNRIYFEHGKFGFNENNLDWQTVIIPFSAFTNNMPFDVIWINNTNPDALIFVDNILVQDGLALSSPDQITRTSQLINDGEGNGSRFVEGIEISDSEIVVKDKSQIVNQILESGKVYKIDSEIILLTGESIIVPIDGLTMDGHGFNISSITTSAANHTIFTSPVGGSGDFVLSHISLTTTGANSKVFNIEDADGNHAIEVEYVNFSGCKSLGKQKGYRQGTLTTVGIYGCEDGLQLSGNWTGYKITNSNIFGFASTGTLFKKDVDTLFTNRFFLSVNIDFPTGAKLTDFQASNFSGLELFQINSSIAKLNGVLLEENSTVLVPNISANDSKSLWVGNIGLYNSADEMYVENPAVTTTYTINWLKNTFFLTMTGNTTFSESNLPASGKNSEEVKIYLTGNFVPTFPAAWYNHMVGTYKGSEINEITVKFVKTGVYFIKINNSLTVYPAPILGSITPVSVLPSSTTEVRIKGSFYTPAGFVLIDGQVINSIEFDPDTGDYILSVSSGVTEGEFDIVISNGTSVTFSGKFIVNLGEVLIPELADWTQISKTGSINLDDPGEIKLGSAGSEGVYRNISPDFILNMSEDFRITFKMKPSPLEPTTGFTGQVNKIGLRLVDATTNVDQYRYVCWRREVGGLMNFVTYSQGTQLSNENITDTGSNFENAYNSIHMLESVSGVLKYYRNGALKATSAYTHIGNMKIEAMVKWLNIIDFKYIKLP